MCISVSAFTVLQRNITKTMSSNLLKRTEQSVSSSLSLASVRKVLIWILYWCTCLKWKVKDNNSKRWTRKTLSTSCGNSQSHTLVAERCSNLTNNGEPTIFKFNGYKKVSLYFRKRKKESKALTSRSQRIIERVNNLLKWHLPALTLNVCRQQLK